MITEVIEKLVHQKSELPTKGNVTFLNPYSYLLMRQNSKTLAPLDRVCIDGSALCTFFRMFGLANVERISFDNTSLAKIVFNRLNDQGGSLYVIGAQAEQAAEFEHYLKVNYPNLKLCKVRDGYFSSEQERLAEAKEIARLNPDVLVCGMGTPLQEQMLCLAKQQGWQGAGYTCGGFIHQTAKGGEDYYPAFFDRLNIRFLYRIIDEPKLIKRYTVDYGKFVFVFIWDFLNYKLRKA